MKIIWQVRQEKDLSKQALSKFNAYFYLSNVEWNYKPVWHIGGSEQREKFELLFIHERTNEWEIDIWLFDECFCFTPKTILQ